MGSINYPNRDPCTPKTLHFVILSEQLKEKLLLLTGRSLLAGLVLKIPLLSLFSIEIFSLLNSERGLAPVRSKSNLSDTEQSPQGD